MIDLFDCIYGYSKKKFWGPLNFKINTNGIYLLLGPNGIGKTTFLDFLNKDISLKKGSLVADSLFFLKNEIREDYLYPSEYMNLFSKIFSIKVNYDNFENKIIKDLSQGQKAYLQLQLIQYLKETTILLDEPSLGLDKIFFDKFKESLIKISKDKIVVIATHEYIQLEDIATDFLFFSRENIYHIKKYKQYFTSNITNINEKISCSLIFNNYYGSNIDQSNNDKEIDNLSHSFDFKKAFNEYY